MLLRLGFRHLGTQLIHRHCIQWLFPVMGGTKLSSTRGICSTSSNMVWGEKHVHLYFWCCHTGCTLTMTVTAGTCRTDFFELTACSNCGVKLKRNHVPWKISHGQIFISPRLQPFHILGERVLTLLWYWCFWNGFWKCWCVLQRAEMKSFYQQCYSWSRAHWTFWGWCIVTICFCPMAVLATWPSKALLPWDLTATVPKLPWKTPTGCFACGQSFTTGPTRFMSWENLTIRATNKS